MLKPFFCCCLLLTRFTVVICTRFYTVDCLVFNSVQELKFIFNYPFSRLTGTPIALS